MIALVATLMAITKEYWMSTRIYDYAINGTCILAWMGAAFPFKTFYIVAFVISILLFILSFILWGRTDGVVDTQKNTTTPIYNSNEMQTVPFMKGYIGKVVAEMSNGSYLGTTLKDGSPTEVIVYSEEPMEPGDQFEIIGIVGTKIMAFKK